MSQQPIAANGKPASPWSKLAILLATIIFLTGVIVGILGYFLGVDQLVSIGIVLFVTGSIPLLIDRVFTRSLIEDIVEGTTKKILEVQAHEVKTTQQRIVQGTIREVSKGVAGALTGLGEAIRKDCDRAFKDEIDTRAETLQDIATDALNAVRETRKTSIIHSPEKIYKRFRIIMEGCITDKAGSDEESRLVNIYGAGADLDDPLYRDPIKVHIRDLCFALNNGIIIQRIQMEECPITWLVVLSQLLQFENFRLYFTSEKEIIARQLFLYGSRDAMMIPREDVLRNECFGIYTPDERAANILRGHFSSKLSHLDGPIGEDFNLSEKIDELHRKRTEYFKEFLANRYLKPAIGNPEMVVVPSTLKGYIGGDEIDQLDLASKLKEEIVGDMGKRYGDFSKLEDIVDVDVCIVASVLTGSKNVISAVTSSRKSDAEKEVAVDNWLKEEIKEKMIDDFSSITDWLSDLYSYTVG